MAKQAAKKPAKKSTKPKKAPSVQGTFIWHEIYAPDADASHQFYAKLIGWKKKSVEMMPGMDYRMFANGKDEMAGVMSTKLPHLKGVPPHWLTYIGVDNVDATCKAAVKLGAKVMAPPMDIPVGRFAVLTDPQGAAFGIYTPKM